MAANPWAADTWNVTEQGKIAKRYGEDAALRLARLAGLDRLGQTHKKSQTAKIYIIQGKRGPKGDPGEGGGSSGTHEFLGFYAPGGFLADQYFTTAATPRATTFPTVNPPDESRATCRVAPTDDYNLYLVADVGDYLDDGSGVICTVTFAANATTGSFVYGTPTTVPVDTPLFIVCQHVPDATITDVQLVFCGDPS